MTEKIFNKNIFKYGTESFLIMYLNQFQIILGADLEQYAIEQKTFTEKNPCNIYFILKRSKVTVAPESVIINKPNISFDCLIQNKNEFKPLKISMDFENAKSELFFKSNYPHNIFHIYDKNEHHITARPAVLLDELYTEEKLEIPLLDFEVLYVGQAYGKDGKRTAIDRLMSHETLLKIYSQASTQHPDSDVWIMLANFSRKSLLASFGTNLVKVKEENKKKEDDKSEHFFNNNGYKFTPKQIINFTEAALIKYFQPKYNIKYKESFPSRKHKSYSECYDLDIRAMSLELDTSEIQRMLYTNQVERRNYHFKTFEFESNEDRYNLLNSIDTDTL
ncbi:hypothetical protein [Flavobacterium sp. GT3P67]|uniref:hypothetical protein n=1 Tax=Flavobacterium sp. GT3P67 TaxID=2541722 RepID=UPI001044DE9E|nr:hypothetical protein [Flavobacterium sp. GT3P67]TDE52718.1 hypothetical protein E0H99_11385 [Flavobacterium sp. GT3P67]